MMTNINIEEVKEEMKNRKGGKYIEETLNTIESIFWFEVAYSGSIMEAIAKMNKTVGLPPIEVIYAVPKKLIYHVCWILTGKNVALRNGQVDVCGYLTTEATSFLDDLTGSAEKTTALIKAIVNNGN